MAQITHGIRKVLSHPLIYSAFQSLMGAHKLRLAFVDNYVKPFPGMKILDIGCGPADILAYLNNIEYWGYDISELYIARARSRFGERGHFNCKLLEPHDLVELPKFDLVLASGLLHHLDDKQAAGLLELAHEALKLGGRLLTIDPCLDASQSRIARFLVRHDRGQNVRTKNGYEGLACKYFSSPRVEVRHVTWIPYTHCIIECQK